MSKYNFGELRQLLTAPLERLTEQLEATGLDLQGCGMSADASGPYMSISLRVEDKDKVAVVPSEFEGFRVITEVHPTAYDDPDFAY